MIIIVQRMHGHHLIPYHGPTGQNAYADGQVGGLSRCPVLVSGLTRVRRLQVRASKVTRRVSRCPFWVSSSSMRAVECTAEVDSHYDLFSSSCSCSSQFPPPFLLLSLILLVCLNSRSSTRQVEDKVQLLEALASVMRSRNNTTTNYLRELVAGV